MPSFAQALEPSCAEERQAFCAALETGLAQRLVDHSVRIENLVGMIVLAKLSSVSSARRQATPRFEMARTRPLKVAFLSCLLAAKWDKFER